MKPIKITPIAKSIKEASSLPTKFGIQKGICEIHGEYQAVVIENHVGTCPTCFELELKKIRETENDQTLEIIKKAQYDEIITLSGIPERYKKLKFENLIARTEAQKDIFEIIKSYADDFAGARKTGQSLIFHGPTGNGKTQLGCAILHSVIDQGFTTKFTLATSAIRRINDCNNFNNKETKTEAYQAFFAPDLLLIDDIGASITTDSSIQIINEIISDRYQERKPTIITSNDEEDELTKLNGKRIMDRMSEKRGMIIPFKWSSIRGDV
jgi:DNA replication protein DnaC